MRKGLALILALLLALSMLSGCNLIGYDEELDGAQIVAKVNDNEITKADWEAYRDYLIDYEAQYYAYYYGITMEADEEMVASYGEYALEQMVQSYVLQDKVAELGYDVLSEEDEAKVAEYATSMSDFYKMMLRYQNYPDVETVEEEAARLAAATPSEATPAEAVATITDAELDAMLAADLEATGYTYDYFYDSEKATIQEEQLRAYAAKDVTISDEDVKAEFDSLAAAQKETYDATPTAYATAVNNGSDVYYVPAGYRGVKHVLVQISEEKQAQLDELETAAAEAENTIANSTANLEELNAADTSEYDEEALAAHNEQKAAYETLIAEAETTLADTQAQIESVTEEAFAEILPEAEEVLAKAKAGEDFDALITVYNDDPGMDSEPGSTTGYLVCEGLTTYVQEFQDAAMALTNVGDVSDLVKTSYGYHILQYTTDIASGEVEYTEEIKNALYDTLLVETENAAFEAAIEQWVNDADVKTFPKIME